MSTGQLRITDQDIREAAISRGFHDSSVVIQDKPEIRAVADCGRWYLLSVKRQPGCEWELLGRRRSRGELLELIEAKS
jgi:hypothetical protein